MNKNDLRFQKTENLIKEAYLSLKKHGSSTVKVKDLCERAMINKTTFYAHYETIEYLHRAVCQDFIISILSKFDKMDKIETDLADFAQSLLDLFSKNMPSIDKLYGDDLYTLVNDIERILMENYIPGTYDEDIELTIRFCIGGAFRLLVFENDPARIHKTVELIERVMSAELQ